ncbi:MAG TPA: pyridoxal phosphate-dependent aminotransferase family protein [Flavobacterium sp.]|uniref:aminotransferase class I/II-fold pyridoxal phosphate-dependent enzyme n=1 Tax=unclassified Flavobacterium TaxID=196869 RepID=UPI000E9722B2|nr:MULTISPECIES: pyridoxal phosphate-dependent aminotransferase family protein [unclassified Flavobacterium]HBI01104.1 8-amino-7-oxononanoate synthase [Flavobacterium sp.]HRE79366.1 pyridoxal phosphate-dependent aminotransferase family protein [Flavobacterium sp.]
MKSLPKSLHQKLLQREQNNALRKLVSPNHLVDFSSNDYLGFAKNEEIFQQTHDLLVSRNYKVNGATGSRLLTGNHSIYSETEEFIAQFHQAEAALIFNSGYDANVGFFSSVPQRNDIILYDELSHASIRDGIQMSLAKSFKFKHNDLVDLENLLTKFCPTTDNQQPKTDNRQPTTDNGQQTTVFIITESIFSMDGDSPDLEKLVQLSEKHNAYLVIDEAHALGVFGKNGEGLVQQLNLHNNVFARIITFGKALGCHGAAVLGSEQLKTYLTNFARSFIYTTGLSPHSVATIFVAYQHLPKSEQERAKLFQNINFFKQSISTRNFQPATRNPQLSSSSTIHSIIIPGNERVKIIAQQLQQNGFDVKPILSPTVPEGQERLRFCLHSYNSQKEIFTVLDLLSTFVF